MAFTTEQYNALNDAIASGTLTVEYADKKVTYRSLSDMLKILGLMQTELTPANTPLKRKYVEYDKGLYPASE